MSNIEEDINLIKLKEISERFSNGIETIEDIINYCRNYEIKFENGLKLRVVEKRYFDKLVERIKELEVLEDDLKDKRVVYIDTPEFAENYIPKQKVKEILDRLHISDIEPWSFYKVSGDILFDLRELLEDK